MIDSLRPVGATRKRLAAVLFCCGLLAPGAALACNPIEALFGACRLDVFRPVYGEPRYAPRHREAPRVKKARAPRAQGLDADGVGPKQTPLEPTVDAPEGSLALFRQDKTLRNGDVVATNEGFRVYRNGRFVAIAHDGGKLAQLESASMKGRPQPQPPRRRVADRRR